MNNKRKLFLNIITLKIIGVILSVFLLSANMLKAQERSSLQDIQEIVAIVNDKVISLYDLDQRTKLIAMAGGARTISGEELEYIRRQAMQALIDDKLKLQEAAKYEVVIGEDEVRGSYENYVSQFNLNPEEFERTLNSQGVEKETLFDQIRGSMAWQSIISGLLMQQVNVTDDEVNNVIDNMERNKGKDEFRISEIFILTTDNSRKDESIQNANNIRSQLENGASFSVMAQQFSQSSTAAVGGDMGWILENELPRIVSQSIPSMQVGDISDPIVTDDGIYIVQLTDKRKILSLNNNDIAVELKHMFFDAENALPSDQYDELNNQVLNAYNSKDGCEFIEDNATSLTASDYGDLGTFRIGELPMEIREDVLSLDVGHGTKLFREPNGYRSFIVCLRDVPEVRMPNFDVVEENLTQSRVQLIARRHLRDLRRDAIVDYR